MQHYEIIIYHGYNIYIYIYIERERERITVIVQHYGLPEILSLLNRVDVVLL
jgi:hypothetical protein